MICLIRISPFVELVCKQQLFPVLHHFIGACREYCLLRFMQCLMVKDKGCYIDTLYFISVLYDNWSWFKTVLVKINIIIYCIIVD